MVVVAVLVPMFAVDAVSYVAAAAWIAKVVVSQNVKEGAVMVALVLVETYAPEIVQVLVE